MSLWTWLLERPHPKSNNFLSNCFTFLFLKPHNSVTHLRLILAGGVEEGLAPCCTVPESAAALDDEVPLPHCWTPPPP